MDPQPNTNFNWSMLWGPIVFAGGIFLAIWSKVSFAKKSDVYQNDGQTKFPAIGFCDRKHDESYKILQEIKAELKAMDDKREQSKTEISNCITHLSKEVGRLQGKVELLSEIKITLTDRKGVP